MNITVLGKYGPYAAESGATSGYLVNKNNTNILLECGSGVLSRVQQYVPISEISAVVLSQLHSDHISDMFTLRYALMKLQQQGLVDKGFLPIKVFAPDSPKLDYSMLLNQNVFEIITMREGLRVHLGDIEMSFHLMQSSTPSFATMLYTDEKVLAYTGDTSLNDEITPFAMGVDMLVANVNQLERERTSSHITSSLTVEQAAHVAKEAGVNKLLLTHILPTADEKEVYWAASEIFKNVEVAQEMMTYQI